MGRRLLRIATALLIVAAVAVAGVTLLSRLAPEWVREVAERSLADALGAPVAIERARLRLGPGLALVGSGVRVWQDPPPAALEVERIEARVRPLPLLLGRVRLRRLALSGATLRVEYDEDGRLRPAPFARFVPRLPAADSGARGDGEAEPAAPEPLLRWIDEVARVVRRAPVPGVGFELRQSRLVLIDHRAAGAPPRELRLDRLYASLGLHAFGRGATFVAGGRAGGEGTPRGHFALQVDRGGDGSARASLNAADLDLRLPAWPLRPGVAPDGRITGSLILNTEDDDRWQLDADIQVPSLRWTLRPAGGLPLRRVSVSRLGLRGSFESGEQRFRLRDGSIELEGVQAALAGGVSRPIQEDSVAALRVELGPMGVRRVWENLLDLVPEAAALAPVMRTVEAGRVDQLEVRARAPLARWPRLLVSGPERGSERLDLRARVSDVRVRLEDGELLEQLGGELEWDGDTLQLGRVRGLRGGEPMPQLDLRLGGASHLLAAAGGEVPPDPLGAVPGLRSLLDIVRSRQDPSGPPRPSQVMINADWVRHPALLRSLEELRAVLAPTPHGVEFAVDGARYGGVPVSGRGSYDGAPPARIVLDFAAAASEPAIAAPSEPALEAAEIEPGEPAQASSAHAPPVVAPDGATSESFLDEASVWARGEFETDAFSLGPLSIRSAAGSFVGERGLLRLTGLDAELAPDARQRGEIVFDLSRGAEVPLQIEFSVPACPLPQLAGALLLAPDDATGRVGAAGRFEGRLRPGRHLLSDLSGDLLVSARDGELRRKLPPFLAVARASNLPFSSLDAVRYDALDMRLRLENGRLRVESFSLQSPDLRALATGSVDVVDPAHEVEGILGVFFFRGLDAALRRIPVVNDLILGSDENLVGAYFALTGPWTEPEAELLATKALAEGPGNIVTGLPGFVKKGLDTIESMLQRGRAAFPPDGPALPEAGS